MTGKKPCLHCGRSIDSGARLCPFCNWEQDRTPDEATLAAAQASAAAVTPYETPARELTRRLGLKALSGIGVVLAMVGAFIVGGLVYGLTTRDSAKERAAEAELAEDDPLPMQQTTGGGDLTLVPVRGGFTGGRTITTAPAAQRNLEIPDEYQRSDATALPAEEYSRVVTESTPPPQAAGPVDPRTITGTPHRPAPLPAPPRPQPPPQQAQQQPPAPAQPAVRRTPPIPVSQPVPNVSRVERAGVVSLVLTVDRSGRVSEVRVVEGLPGVTPAVVSAVQRWRFNPATENGSPVEGQFPVEITFNRTNG
jgi:TonB family protein